MHFFVPPAPRIPVEEIVERKALGVREEVPTKGTPWYKTVGWYLWQALWMYQYLFPPNRVHEYTDINIDIFEISNLLITEQSWISQNIVINSVYVNCYLVQLAMNCLCSVFFFCVVCWLTRVDRAVSVSGVNNNECNVPWIGPWLTSKV